MRNAVRRAVLPVLVVLLVTSQAHADRIHVNINTPLDGDGSTWGQAMRSLVDALAMAQPGDEVWVAQGTYGLGVNALRDDSFVVPTGVALHGGFVGGENALSERPADFGASQTFLGGGQNNAYSVIRLSGGTGDTIIDRFIVRNGNAEGDPNGLLRETRGGGLFLNMRGNVLIRDVVVRDCDADGDGGGLYALRSGLIGTLRLERVRFNRCISEGAGGGAYLSVNTIVSDASFEANDAREGGGIAVEGNTFITVRDSSIISNTATGFVGGGVFLETDASSNNHIFTDTLFIDNRSSEADGGAIAFRGFGTCDLVRCTIALNSAESPGASGGAILMFARGSSELIIENSLVAGNVSDGPGAGIRHNPIDNGSTFIVNSTMVGNATINAPAGAISFADGELFVINSILWDNQDSNGGQSASLAGAGSTTVTLENSIIGGLGVGPNPVLPAVNTTGDDPMFVDADGPDNLYGTADDNVRLAPGSPAIDAGRSNLPAANQPTDFYGDPRLADDPATADTGVPSAGGLTVDIGAAEFQPAACPADTNGDGVVNPADFNAWVIAFNTQSPACDQNGDGLCNPADFNAWVINFNAGC
ncbi:MAG: GC-type dockerin domain-anchored protein [Planctomycetota bacterium]